MYVEKKAEIGLDFSEYVLFGNESNEIVHENENKITVIDISAFINSATVQEEKQSLCGVVYTLSLSNATALGDFDADFFADSAVVIDGKGVEFSDGQIILTDEANVAKVTFAAEKVTLEVEIRNYTKPEKPVIPDDDDGFSYRFFTETATVEEILENCGIISSYYPDAEYRHLY